MLVRETTKCSLKEAKEYVDQLGTQKTISSIHENIDDQLSALVSKGKKLEAIKLYKEQSGLSLAASNDYIDRLQQHNVSLSSGMHTAIDRILQQQNEGQKTQYNYSWIVRLLLIMIIAAVLAWMFFRQ